MEQVATMIVCNKCGERNEAGAQFCGACGEFLEWAGEVVPPPGPAAGTVPPGQTAAVPPAYPVVPGAVPPPSPPPAGMPPAGMPYPGAPGAAPLPPPGAPAGPPAGPGGGPNQLGLVRPDQERERRRLPPPPDLKRRPQPGELICRHCGAGNATTRRFCNACGTSLTQAPVVVPLPWWRRLLNRLFRRRAYTAGSRRNIRPPVRWQRPVLLLAVLAVLGLLVAFPGRPLLQRGVVAVQDRMSKHAPMVPVAVRASSSAPGAGPEHLIDGVDNNYWAPAGPAAGAWVEMDLANPSRLLDVILTPGISKNQQQFLTQGRPAVIDALVTDRSGRLTRATIRLQDKAGPQTFAVKADNAVRVRFTLVSAYGVPPGQLVALAEVELYVRA